MTPLFSNCAVVIHVAPEGRPGGTGTVADPVPTLGEAKEMVRSSVRSGQFPISVSVQPGTYYLAQPLIFEAEDSGTAESPVRWVANGEVVISGAIRIRPTWQSWRDGIFCTTLTETDAALLGTAGMDQLFIDGKRQPMSRFPNIVPGKHLYEAWDLDHDATPEPNRDALAPSRVKRWTHPAGAFLHAMHPALWGDMHYRVTGRSPEGSLQLEGGWQNNRPSKIHPVYRYVENVLEELDAPGEWYYEAATRSLYFQPPEGLNLQAAQVELVTQRQLIELRGTSAQPVHHLSFEGFNFRHARRTFMDNREPLLRSDWTTYRGGAVFVTGAENITLTNCTFESLGGNALFVSGFARQVSVVGCLFRECGANGIAFVGSPSAVRSPLFRYEHTADLAQVDRTPGPQSPDYPQACTVQDCLITRTGRDEKQTAPVQISMASGITVRHCSIYEVPRAGINIGDGTWGGHLIEYCDIFDTVLETGDHGSFNSWGRDRYWVPRREEIEARVETDSRLPMLDVVDPIVLRFSRWRCDHGWDIDLDDGSTNYQIYGNLLLRGGLKLREGYRRIVEQNVIVNNSLHPHVWPHDSGDIFRHNIVMGAYRPAGGMPTDRWGAEVDHNFFVATAAELNRFATVGCDANSAIGDARFVDPAHGDFRVRADSPARKIGFTGWDFAPEDYGVRSPRLRSLVRTPVIPGKLRDPSEPAADSKGPLIYHWGPCAFRDFVGDEFSAYGAPKGAPGILITASNGKEVPLRAGDVLIELDSKPVESASQFIRLLESLRGASAGRSSISITVLRSQQNNTLKLPLPLPTPRL